MDWNTVDVEPRDYGYGKTRWTERLYLEVTKKGEAFFGRMIGLYDAATNFNTDIESLEDLHRRSDIFRTINIWIDNAPKAVRNAHSRICGDFPGIGKDAVLDINLDLTEVEKWAEYEGECIDVAEVLQKFYNGIWDADFVQMGKDLHMNIRSLNYIRRWAETPSWECRRIVRRSLESIIKDGFAQAYVDGEDLSPFKEKLMTAWETEEKALLSFPANKRNEENFPS